MIKNSDEEMPWRRELNVMLRRVYDALPEPLKTTYRKGAALKSFESFVESFNCLMNRSGNHPRFKIAESPTWELWMHYSDWSERPKGEPLHLEFVSRRDYEEFGELVERNSLMGYRDIIGETDYPTDTVWRSCFGQ
jgi:hypothetical protein